MVAPNPSSGSASASGSGSTRRSASPRGQDVEPKSLKHPRDEAVMHEEWRERMREGAEEALHRTPREADDFDIAAWFAVEEEREGREHCIAECWYG